MTAGELAPSGYEPVEVTGRPAGDRLHAALFRCRSGQPSRRAVLHVQAAGDPPLPAGLGAWYTERAFHFYVAGLRLPSRAPVGARPAARYLAAAFADLDAACAHLRGADGIASVIVSAQGRGAIAAALWRHSRAAAADALVLLRPQLPAGSSLRLDVDCPVLVLTDESGGPPGVAARRWPGRRRTGPADRGGLQLGGHVTSLRLRAGADRDDAAGGQLFDELGRWLGAYMYGQGRDQLL
jgi:hypothetical protein